MPLMKNSRYSIVKNIILLYLIPVVLLSASVLSFAEHSKAWKFFSIGLFLCIITSVIIYLRLCKWESNVKSSHKRQPMPPLVQSVPQIDYAVMNELQQKNSKLFDEIQIRDADLKLTQQNHAECMNTLKQVENELESYKIALQEQLKNQEAHTQNLHATIQDQKAIIEKQLGQISVLQGKEKDLHYELKTLLKVANIDPIQHLLNTSSAPNPRPIKTAEKKVDIAPDPLSQLIDKAIKIPGSYQENNPSFNRYSSANNQALAMRSMREIFQSESSSVAFLFSRKDNRMMLVNSAVQETTGWTPESFVHNFTEIVPQSQWQQIIYKCEEHKSVKEALPFKTKSGKAQQFHCHAGIVPSGVFKEYIIGTLKLS